MIQWRNKADSYGRISKTLHWLMAALILSMIALGLGIDSLPSEWRPRAIGLHKSFGVLLLLLVSVRLYWRLTSVRPTLAAGLPRLMALAASLGHWALYALMFAMPLTGWAMGSAFGKNVTPFGLFTLPALVGEDRALGALLRNLHGVFGYALLGVIGLHVLAALYHHFVRKDGVLRGILG